MSTDQTDQTDPPASLAFQRMDVAGANAGRPEPALAPEWDDFKKLTWKAGVVFDETGLDVMVRAAFSTAAVFDIKVGYTFTTASYRDAWTLLTGVATGAREAKRVEVSR